jgi:glycosyltransferase involved in cell wall biosynthesis
VNVLILTTDAFGGIGGIAQYNRDLICAIDSSHKIQSITVLTRNLPLETFDRKNKIRILKRSALGRFHYFVAAVKASKNDFQLVICGHINLLPLALVCNLFIKAPIVLLAYGIEVWETRLLKKILTKFVTSIWVISNFTKERMNSWALFKDEAYKVLPNAIHLEQYGLGDKRSDLLKLYGLVGKKVLLTLSRISALERYKGHDQMIEAMRELVLVEPRLVYVIAGGGDDLIRLQEKVTLLNLEDHVRFIGYVSDLDKPDIFRLADVFVMPSKGEGFGFVFLEALACGIPVVGSHVDGSKEALIDGDLGELVWPDCPSSIKKGVLTALKKKKDIPTGLYFFSWENFKKRVLLALDEVL